tara:strand:- start:560 stop:1957 length:1398 start_codon:yes stop_codon:yes gene_type:complete
MATILNITYDQSFNVPLERKSKFGEVKTDYKLIEKMFNLIPKKLFNNPNIKWCDPCSGSGEFMIYLFKILYNSLHNVFPEPKSRRDHIIHNMLWIVEINDFHIPRLKKIFGEDANIIHGNYLDINNLDIDIVIGNPPFNINGSIKVPTNKFRLCKKNDGISIWSRFIIHSLLNILKKSRYGYLLFITPSIWMKRDHKMYKIMLMHTIKKIHTMNSSETSKIFHGHAQTPTCYFFMSKKKRHKFPHWRKVDIYDNMKNKYVSFNHESCLLSLPLCGISIINRLVHLGEYYPVNNIRAYKTSMRPGYKNLSVSDTLDDNHPFENITTCLLKKNQPILKINYSNIKCDWNGVPKLILAHKMYGFPYLDEMGRFGISNRDNYVIVDYSIEKLKKIRDFFYTRLGLYLLEATRYRMRYLEKYIFDFIPEIIINFDVINDEILFDTLNLNEMERNYINTFHKKHYLKSILP